MEPQKPQISRKKPQLPSLKSRNPSRKKAQILPTEKPQKPQSQSQPEPSIMPEIPGPEAARSPVSSGGSGTIEPPKENFADLIQEAQELQPTPTPEPGAEPTPEPSPSLPPIEIKPTFADQITNLTYGGIRWGIRQYTKGDLVPMTAEQRGQLSQSLAELSGKYLPRFILEKQEEVGAVGVLANIIIENYRPAPKEPTPQPQPQTT